MSPELGRFLQPDPIGFKGDASNLYRYCGNDSVDRTDPSGLTDLNYVGDGEENHDIRRYLDTKPYLNPNEVISVSAHATPLQMFNTFWGGKGYRDLSVKQVVQDLKNLDKFNNNKTMAIRLYMCRAGDWKFNKDCPAQQIARDADRHVQATGAWINPKTGALFKTPTCQDLSWYDFSPDGSEPTKIADPSGFHKGGFHTKDNLGGSGSPTDTRRTYGPYDSTTEAAGIWEASWGPGGWINADRLYNR